MQAILDFFAGLIDIILSPMYFLISFIEDIVYVVKLTGQFLLNVPFYFSWVPTAFSSLIFTIFTIVVIYKVIGREG